MARQALAVQARPITLAALTKQIQAAVECQGWTVLVAREGDSLVVDMTGAVCPDPLLAMMMVEAELKRSDTAGLEAVKLYGHCAMAEISTEKGDSVLESPGWMSVIDLDGYFSRRAALSPEAFGLAGVEASRMACEAERDRYSAAAVTATASIVRETESTDNSLDSEPQVSELALELERDEYSLDLDDPWALELPEEGAAAVSLPLEHFPRIAQTQTRQDATVIVDEPSSLSSPQLSIQAAQNPAGVQVERKGKATIGLKASPQGEQSKAQAATQTLASLTGYDRYRSFITEQSSWFAQTVKDDPRLHTLAKQRQHYTIGTLSHYLEDTLAENECLMDLVPARKRDRGCGLIFTDQRVIALSQPSRRNSSGSSRSNRPGLQVWMVPWSWVHKVEICNDALRFHYGRTREHFSIELEAPYHLRNAMPRDIPVRMVREIVSSKQRALETKAGLAMVAGVMFALGSGFSLLNNMMNREQINARSNSPVAGQVDSVAPPLMMTTNHEQCVNSFNTAAQPHAYATLNQVTQTLQVNLQNQALLQMPQQQFDQTAASVAQEILSSCQAKAINQVVVTNGSLRYQQLRPAANMNSVAGDELKLF